jgi:Flp pilus assembly protein TadB
MKSLISPLCLFLAILLLIFGFALWSVEAPEAGSELHQARAAGDEDYEAALEAQLEQRRFARSALLACLFGGSAAMTVAGFVTMRSGGS